MSYRIDIERDAQRTLRKLDATIARRVGATIESLAQDPYPGDARALRERPGVLRVRVGDYRLLYEVADDALIIYIILIAHRRESYRRLLSETPGWLRPLAYSAASSCCSRQGRGSDTHIRGK